MTFQSNKNQYFNKRLFSHRQDHQNFYNNEQVLFISIQIINGQTLSIKFKIILFFSFIISSCNGSGLIRLQQKNSSSARSHKKVYKNLLMELEKYAIFLDDSGSVSGFTNYWTVVTEILAEYSPSISNYYLWHHDTRPSSKKEFEELIARQTSFGGNYAWKVAQEVVNKKYTHIILITDGEIMRSDVEKCDQILEKANKEGFHIHKAICFTIGQRGEPNLSVTCAFTRYGESRVFSKGGDNPLRTVMQYTKEDFKILEELAEISVQNFQVNFQKIQQLIIAKNMGRDTNPEMKDQLVHMKTRLLKEYSKIQAKKEPVSVAIRNALKRKDTAAAFEIAAKMANNYFTDETIGDLDKKITALIALCGDLRGKYSLDQIRSNKMATATRAEEGKLDQNVELEQLSKNLVECPIIMDEDVPQILIDECDPFLLGLEKPIVDDINACPLRILNYPHLKAKFKALISNFTGVKYSDKFKQNPYTRRKLLGAIPLGTHKSHIAVGNSTLAKMVSGGKVMGNLNLYYAVLWLLVIQGEIEYLSPIQANLTEHLRFRLTTTHTMASLCGLPKFVCTQVSTDIALWFCLSSGRLNTPTDHDAFRFHLFDIEHMRRLVDVLDYPLDEGFERHFLRTKALFYFLDKHKRSTPNQKKALKTLFRGLYQRGFFIDTSKFSAKFKEVEVCSEFIPIDGAADEAQLQEVLKHMPKFCAGLTKEDLLYVSALLDDQKLFSDIQLPYNPVLPSIPEAQTNWKFGLKELQNPVEINAKTLRPSSEVNGQSWRESAKAAFGVEQSELFKGCKYYQQFVLKHKKLPTRDQLAVFYYNRYVQAGKTNTLPFLTEQWIDQLLSRYSAVFPVEAGIKEVISTLKQSRAIEHRKAIEISL